MKLQLISLHAVISLISSCLTPPRFWNGTKQVKLPGS